MVQMLGAVLVAGGAAWLGFGAALSLRERGRALENMANGLAMLARELEMDEPPLPRLMERLIPRSRGPAKELFQGCAKALDRLEQEEFSRAWQRLCAGQNDIGEDGQQALIPLGELLGRSTCREQVQGVNRVRERLLELARQAGEDYRHQGKVYRTLGLSGGAFLVILLL